MTPYTAILSSEGKEWEEIYNVPDKLDPEDTIKTTIRMFNRNRKIKVTFVRLKTERPKRKRKDG